MVTLRRPQAPRFLQAVTKLTSSVGRYAEVLGGLAFSRRHVRAIMIALALVGTMTLCLIAVKTFVDLHHVSSAYLIPVLIAAIRLGLVPALVVAIGGVGASAFFFYPPIYDFRVHNPEQLLDLPLFVVVAMVTSQLAARAQVHARSAREREAEMRALYAFSKRLAVATDAGEIYSAIQDHLSAVAGCRVVYFEAGASPSASRHEGEVIPESVWRAVYELRSERDSRVGISVDHEHTGTRWLIRAVSSKNAAFGLVAIDVGHALQHGHQSMQHSIDAALADAAATLERLDVARAIGDAKLRTEADTLRAALMGSVSHALRTPLASIMGSASILVRASAITEDPRLAGLASIIRDEAERLNSDIQRLLDASRISSAGVRPHMAWVDIADIVNAALAGQDRRLAAHQVVVRLSDDLPLVHADQVLIEQALGQILDNAAKYSPRGSTIRVEARSCGDETDISISDEGAGLSAEERDQVFERFYRGPRTRGTTSGSGLGLWIAGAFVAACGGRVEATSNGVGCGSSIRIVLPQAPLIMPDANGGPDE
jgi:two-component system, OmpR family, sensor histidine kinase KdpD